MDISLHLRNKTLINMAIPFYTPPPESTRASTNASTNSNSNSRSTTRRRRPAERQTYIDPNNNLAPIPNQYQNHPDIDIAHLSNLPNFPDDNNDGNGNGNGENQEPASQTFIRQLFLELSAFFQPFINRVSNSQQNSPSTPTTIGNDPSSIILPIFNNSEYQLLPDNQHQHQHQPPVNPLRNQDEIQDEWSIELKLSHSWREAGRELRRIGDQLTLECRLNSQRKDSSKKWSNIPWLGVGVGLGVAIGCLCSRKE